ncbi:hypothetical protein [Pseudomonas sp. GOM6]|nr:hypothetical protein [Pseudomonas sp. GOM6]MDG1581062.1 hypothetical protein [Pseudomonas sp. GOM6]
MLTFALIGLSICAAGVLAMGAAYCRLLREYQALALGERETVIEKSF